MDRNTVLIPGCCICSMSMESIKVLLYSSKALVVNANQLAGAGSKPCFCPLAAMVWNQTMPVNRHLPPCRLTELVNVGKAPLGNLDF